MAKPIVITFWGKGVIIVDVSENPDMVKDIDYIEEGESIILKKLSGDKWQVVYTKDPVDV